MFFFRCLESAQEKHFRMDRTSGRNLFLCIEKPDAGMSALAGAEGSPQGGIFASRFVSGESSEGRACQGLKIDVEAFKNIEPGEPEDGAVNGFISPIFKTHIPH